MAFSQDYAEQLAQAGYPFAKAQVAPKGGDVSDLPAPIRLGLQVLTEAPQYASQHHFLSPRGLAHAFQIGGYDAMRIANTQMMGGWAGKEQLHSIGQARRAAEKGETVVGRRGAFLTNWSRRLFHPRSLSRFTYDDRVLESSGAQRFGALSGGEYQLAKGVNALLMGTKPITSVPILHELDKPIGSIPFFRPLTDKLFPSIAAEGGHANAFSGGWNGLNVNAWRIRRGKVSAEHLGKLYDTISANNPDFAAGGLSKESFLALGSEQQAGLVGSAGARGGVQQFVSGLAEASRGGGSLTDATMANIAARSQRSGVAAADFPAMKGANLIRRGLEFGKSAEGAAPRGLLEGATNAFRGAAIKGGEGAGAGVLERAGVAGAGRAAGYLGADLAGDLIGDVIPGLNVLFWVKTAFDVAKLTGKLVNNFIIKPAAKFATDAWRSVEGGINKAPGTGWRGQGFTDTEASATSRQRGVMAIANSRLNARSVLGSEAGMLYRHFG